MQTTTTPVQADSTPPLEDRPLAVFDLDGTLVRKDTFLPFLFSYGRRYRRYLSCALMPFPIVAYLAKLMSDRSAKQRLVASFLRNQPQARIDEHAEWFCEHWVTPRLNEPVVEALRRHQSMNHRVILLSASPSVYVPRIGEFLGISEVVCTRVGIQNDTCLGTLVGPNCKGEAKLETLKTYLGMPHPPFGSSSYGDSKHDFPVLRWVDNGLLVRGTQLLPVPAA